MISKKRILIGICILLVGILFLDLASAQFSSRLFSGSQGSYTSTHYGSSYDYNRYYASEGRLKTYWPDLTDKDSCEARQDILIQVSPVGCQPAVVRSDLLEEQNVAVFCQLDALQFNPLVDVKQIRNIRFKGNYPEEVVGVGFHPAQAALRTRDKLLGSPLINNIGYVVVVLKRQESEREMVDFVNFTLTASLDYYSGNAFGTGKSEFLLREVSEVDWVAEQAKQSFFNGKYSLRLLDSTPEYVDVAIYHQDKRISSLKVDKGKSKDVYVPGSYCQTSMKVKYDGLVSSPKIKATLKVEGDTTEVGNGSRFLNNKCRVLNIEKEGLNSSSVELSCGRERFTLAINARDGNSSVDALNEVSYVGANETYFDNAKESYLELVEEFPELKQQGAQDVGGSESFAEKGLDSAIDLAIEYNKERSAVELIGKYLEIYPSGVYSEKHEKNLADLLAIDYTNAGRTVNIDNDFKFFRLVSVEEPKKKSSAKISWGSSEEIEEGSSKEFGGGKITLDKIVSADKVKVTTYCSKRNADDGTTDFNKDNSYTLSLNDREGKSSCGEILRLKSVDVEEVARVKVSSNVRTSGETNFTVGVGIEKRAIELNPEKSRQKIDNLNKTIQKWESISENLGKVVKGLKGACFATAGILTVKNFFTGLSGEALARQQVMRGPDGWTEYCKEAVNANPPEFVSMTQCYNSKAPEISKDVDAYTKAIKLSNDKTRGIESRHKLGDKTDYEKSKAELISVLKSAECKDVSTGLGSGETIEELLANINPEHLSYEKVRDMYFNCLLVSGRGGELSGDNVGLDSAKENLLSISESFVEKKKVFEVRDGLGASFSGTGLSGRSIPSYGNVNSVRGTYSGGTLKDGEINGVDIAQGTEVPAQIITYDGEPYLVLLQETSGGNYHPEKIYSLSKNGGSNYNQAELLSDDAEIKGRINSYRKVDASSYNNKFAPGEAKVSYHQSVPYTGIPAIIPFDEEDGWYVAVEPTLPSGGGRAIESNGRPKILWICNVMEDGKVDFFGGIKDECRQFRLDAGQPPSFSGLSLAESESLLRKAISAYTSAARERDKKAGEKVNILGKAFEVAAPAAYLPGTQCQDYMSPEDCKLLFNVCDPVICPSSRCNLGGTYHVSDVIQTGIVGSALLCLPNIQEEIIMPVCLTGIKAGIDGYLSILKQHQACLQENLESGRTVGICDEITSIYTCEFFWRQAAPIANALLPKIVENVYYGGNIPGRGGGEYLTVKNAWDNTQGSIDYFTQSYAVNSLEAFKIRSVEEAGSQVCRAWISLKGPKSFETLIEPDSPTQFHAWFSAIPFSDATVPATAQYKVFYHIFAGNDAGTSFNVYLKDPAEGAYYSVPTVNVATGFVSKGESVSETKDFTAPAGYKQLCVRINDKEECGFKQVSTSFALNYVRDEFVQDEMDRADIKGAKDCVSGSLNAAALLNPNLQEAAQEAIDPAVYNRGIVRICATSNPGEGSDPTRFTKVGYCDEPAVGCWLDGQSINNAYTAANSGAREESSKTFEGIQSGQEVFTEDFNMIGDSTINQKEEEMNGKVRRVLKETITEQAISSLIREFDEIINPTSSLILNPTKAMFMLMKADFYEQVFRKTVKPEKPVDASEPSADEENESDGEENRETDESTETETNEVLVNYSVNENNGKEFILVGEKETEIYKKGIQFFIENSDLGVFGYIDFVDGGIIKIDIDKVNAVAENISDIDKSIFEDLNEKNYNDLKAGDVSVDSSVLEILNN